MHCKDRTGRRVEGGEGQDRFLQRLYVARVGRACVKVLIQPWVSRLGGRVFNSGFSRVGIPRFTRDALRFRSLRGGLGTVRLCLRRRRISRCGGFRMVCG